MLGWIIFASGLEQGRLDSQLRFAVLGAIYETQRLLLQTEKILIYFVGKMSFLFFSCENFFAYQSRFVNL